MSAETTVTLDVRADIRAGRNPFGSIIDTVSRLKSGERLRLFAPFEPVPLYGILRRQGFACESRQTPTGDWEVILSRQSDARPDNAPAPATIPTAGGCDGPAEVDARGLEPPQPLVVILDALERLARGRVLRAYTDRRPLHLYARLDERGFSAVTEEQPDGSFVTTIRHV